jgi:hypothetical protein
MKFSLKHIYKYLTSKDYRSKTLAQRLDDEHKKEANKHWAKIEKGGHNELQWTDYTDHNGEVFRLYDLIPDPGFPYTFLDKKEDKDE